jgi:IS5 family transposase
VALAAWLLRGYAGVRLIPDEPGEVYADRAYDALSVEEAIKAKGGTARLLRARAIAGCRPKSSKRATVRRGPFSVAGSRQIPSLSLREGFVSKRPAPSPGSRKSSEPGNAAYHFRALRWIGLVKARLRVHLAAIAYNIKRHWRLQSA